jgi:hypothetical protein
MNEDNLSNVGGKLVNISGTRKGNILKTKLMSLNQTVRIGTSEACIGAQLNLRRVTNLQLTC